MLHRIQPAIRNSPKRLPAHSLCNTSSFAAPTSTTLSIRKVSESKFPAGLVRLPNQTQSENNTQSVLSSIDSFSFLLCLLCSDSSLSRHILFATWGETHIFFLFYLLFFFAHLYQSLLTAQVSRFSFHFRHWSSHSSLLSGVFCHSVGSGMEIFFFFFGSRAKNTQLKMSVRTQQNRRQKTLDYYWLYNAFFFGFLSFSFQTFTSCFQTKQSNSWTSSSLFCHHNSWTVVMAETALRRRSWRGIDKTRNYRLPLTEEKTNSKTQLANNKRLFK